MMCNRLLSIILSINLLNIVVINGQCAWTAQNVSQGLDLSCLAGTVINLNDSATPFPHLYKFSICANAESCPGKGSAMVAQDSTNPDEDLCFVLGKYEGSIAPKIYDGDDSPNANGDFQFEYPNGGDCGGRSRTWVPRFTCEPGTEFRVAGDVTERTETCVYDAQIFTKYACFNGQTSCAADDSGLSGGWIFIIILVCGLFAYCVFGYIVMALTVNKAGGFGDFGNNIPNKSLWVNCIPLVMAGCSVTKDFLVGLTNRGGSDKEDTLVEESAGNEETA